MSESNPRVWAIQHPDPANAKVGDEVTVRSVSLGPTHSAEIDRLLAEVEHWKSHAEEAGDGFAQVCRDYARATARLVLADDAIRWAYGLPLQHVIDTYQTRVTPPGGSDAGGRVTVDVEAERNKLRSDLGAIEVIAERAARKGYDLDPHDVLDILSTPRVIPPAPTTE